MPSSRALKLCLLMACLILEASAAGNFYRDVKINFGDGRAKIDKSGQRNFTCKSNLYLAIQLAQLPHSLSSQGERHDEIDFEFLGNASGQPCTLHTNVYAQGKGNREQQFRLWFMLGKPDGSPIRAFNNNEGSGIPFPKNQPMKVYCSLWNADDWATQGGQIKTDWTLAPFLAFYRNFNADACVWSASAGSSCTSKTPHSINTQAWETQGLDAKGRNRMRWVQSKFIIYDYCKDSKRVNGRFPAECRRSRFL
ncbi:xyloglucan endotransglucosylase protein 1-like [Coffea arabica]|uniref:Xyloglucan endotransglucosylase/hydrolase n=1 Tax=Coffea arabica TaxID=13443 RepID=A0A6P6WVK3_COFAR|nr:xyloglucan endotransglucosylase/hydrolase protein 22-like [Coffea arabica]